MENLAKIQKVATAAELTLISMEFRMFVDEYNAQSIEDLRPITSMFEPFTREIMQKIQKETHRWYGAGGMVMVSQILPAMGLITNHKLYN